MGIPVRKMWETIIEFIGFTTELKDLTYEKIELFTKGLAISGIFFILLLRIYAACPLSELLART